jgi:parallel beta-helix repeat protein
MKSVTVGNSPDCTYITDGLEDDVEINAALQEASKNGGGHVLLVPGERYYITANVIVPQNCVLTCPNANNFQSKGVSANINSCAEFRINRVNGTGKKIEASLVLESHTKVSGIKFYYPDQNTGAPPDEYAPSILVPDFAVDMEVSNCNFVNSYIGMDLPVLHETLNFHHNIGSPLFVGVRVGERAGDSDRFISNHFISTQWPELDSEWKEPTPNPAIQWIRRNGIAFMCTYLENSFFLNNFAFGYHTMFRVTGSSSTSFVGNTADTCLRGFDLAGSIRSTISGNNMNCNGEFQGGSYFSGCSGLALTGNDFAGYEISFEKCDQVEFVGNTAWLCHSHGPWFHNCRRITIANNTINTTAKEVDSYQGILMVACDLFTIGGNVLTVSHQGILVEGCKHFSIHDNIVESVAFLSDDPPQTRENHQDAIFVHADCDFFSIHDNVATRPLTNQTFMAVTRIWLNNIPPPK